ncbi:MAG: alpha/beta hydrolase [Bacteroidales bacterium]|nr:alpha/beta hydrolase [Bacteroidales bacterium]
MERTITYQGAEVWYSVEGKGEALLFLHGYLESSEIWKSFTKRFTTNYRVICMDIPGHGRSGMLGKVHEMDEMARAANAVLENEGIRSVTVFGHSMGGYVTMEFLNQYPDKVRRYCIFHSTCFADNDEKKLNRDREIGLVKCGKKMQIIHTNIPKAFADINLERCENDISRAKNISSVCSDDGIIALLRGMKNRKDHSELMSKSGKPLLIIYGEKDNYIDTASFSNMVRLASQATVIILKNSGHLSFVEEPDRVFAGIINFLNS